MVLDLVREWINGGRSDLAERELRRRLAVDPEDATAHALLAMALISLRRGEEALAAAREAARLAPYDPLSVEALAQVMVRLEHVDGEAAARRALATNPGAPAFHALLAAALLQRAGRGSRARRLNEEALQAADAGLALVPNDAECLRQRAQALVRLRRMREAREASEAALRARPEEAVSHAVHGTVELASGNGRRGMASLREALRISPEHDSADEQLGRLDNSRFNAAVALQVEAWRRPLRGVLAVILIALPPALFRDWTTPGWPHGLFALAYAALAVLPAWLGHRRPGLVGRFRQPGSLAPDEVRWARVWLLATLSVSVGCLLFAFLT